MRVSVVPYDQSWPSAFESVRRELAAALAHTGALAIEHMGSTAVPGLPAKPVIDVDVVVDEARLASAIAALHAAGYTHEGERGIPGRHAFTSPPDGVPRHVYVCVDGCLALRNHLAVRDALRGDPVLRAEYAAVKVALAERDLGSVEKYVDGKTAVLQKILGAAGMTPHDLDAVASVNARPREAEQVVVGILVQDGLVLLGHRSPARRWYPDVWDLPGGHVDPGETGRAALERELREELDIVVVSADEGQRVQLGDVLLDVWTVSEWTGTPVNRAPDEHNELRWFTADELPVATLAHPALEPLLRGAL